MSTSVLEYHDIVYARQGRTMYDCGCSISRPKTATTYATRWRVYVSKEVISLKCRDCGRIHHFALRRSGVQVIQYGEREEAE